MHTHLHTPAPAPPTHVCAAHTDTLAHTHAHVASSRPFCHRLPINHSHSQMGSWETHPFFVLWTERLSDPRQPGGTPGDVFRTTSFASSRVSLVNVENESLPLPSPIQTSDQAPLSSKRKKTTSAKSLSFSPSQRFFDCIIETKGTKTTQKQVAQMFSSQVPQITPKGPH